MVFLPKMKMISKRSKTFCLHVGTTNDNSKKSMVCSVKASILSRFSDFKGSLPSKHGYICCFGNYNLSHSENISNSAIARHASMNVIENARHTPVT